MLSIVMEVLVPLCTILGGYLSGFLFDEMKVKNKLKLDNIGMCSNADAWNIWKFLWKSNAFT